MSETKQTPSRLEFLVAAIAAGHDYSAEMP